MAWDILIRGGNVIDGSGAPGVRADVAIEVGCIARIAPDLPPEADKIIDAGGLAVTPGFIDIKTHSDFVLPINPKAESKVRQGVTTEIIGHCGFSVAPVLPGKTQLLTDYLSGGAPWLPFREMSFPEYLDTFPATSVNAGDAGRPQHAAADGDGPRRPRADRRRVPAHGRFARRGPQGGRARVFVGSFHPARQLRGAGRTDAIV
jgi:N-acyl-D-aspartate/D-glutamate deacylase